MAVPGKICALDPAKPCNVACHSEIGRAALTGAELRPVDIIQVGSTYFVVGGHHRISVARALYRSHVDAAVTVREGVN